MKDITIVDNGQKAVDAVADNNDNNNFDIIFMDMQMPVLDGIGATKQIVQMKKKSMTNTPKIIFVTAHALTKYQQEAEAAGGDGFISKPFNRRQIVDMVESLMMN